MKKILLAIALATVTLCSSPAFAVEEMTGQTGGTGLTGATGQTGPSGSSGMTGPGSTSCWS